MNTGPVKNRRFKRSTIRKFTIAASSLLAVAIIAGAVWYFLGQQQATKQAETQVVTNKVLEDVSAVAQKKTSAIKAELNELAISPDVVALFVEGDKEKLEAAAAEKQSTISNALRLRFLKAGRYELDRESIPPLSYASLDMLKDAETNDNMPIEALLVGSPNQHIVVISSVKNEASELLGFVHLSLDIAALDNVLADINLDGGYLELVQQAAGSDIVIKKTGNEALAGSTPAESPIAGTKWKIKYFKPGSEIVQTNQVVEEESQLPIIPIAAGLAILVLLVLGFLFIKKSKGSTSRSEEGGITFEGAVRAISEGAHAGVDKLIPHLPKSDSVALDQKGISQGLSVDDATLIPAAKQSAPETVKPASPESTAPAKPVEKPDVKPVAAKPAPAAAGVDPVIFRAYDIRGVVGKTLTADTVYKIARAIGTKAKKSGANTINVGRDGRTSGPELSEALIKGLRETGCNVVDIGMVPTPVLYFSTYLLETGSGVMLTGSHNAPEYNGLKIMIAGNTLSGDEILELKAIVDSGKFAAGQGELSSNDIGAEYIRRVTDDIPVAFGGTLKVVVDCGNGVAGNLAPQLLNALGHDIVQMYCDIDGNFPNHHPDPSQPENLQALIDKVKAENADVGFAFDGDGDRLGIVDAEGNIIWPDRQLMLLAKDVLSRNAGANIIFDVKCSRHLKKIIEENGGKPLMWKTGHSFIKNKMKEVDAPLAGEMSGHIFFKERWYGFDDALYTAARFLEIFTTAKAKPAAMFAELPDAIATPELRLSLKEDLHKPFMKKFIEKMSASSADLIDIDGARLEYPDGWGLARPSNTSPYIIMRFEGDSAEALQRIQAEFKAAITQIMPKANVPF